MCTQNHHLNLNSTHCAPYKCLRNIWMVPYSPLLLHQPQSHWLFFRICFSIPKRKKNICTAILLSATQKWVYWISLFSGCNSLYWLLKRRFALIPHPKLPNDLWRGQNLFFYFLQNILASIFLNGLVHPLKTFQKVSWFFSGVLCWLLEERAKAQGGRSHNLESL